MVQINVKLKGIPKVRKNITKIQKIKLNNVNDEIHKQGFALVAEVIESISGHRAEPTSVDTSWFKQSIGKDSNMRKFLISQVKSNVEYAEYLEDGTSKIKERKHFANSLARRKKIIKTKVAEAVKKKIII